MTTNHVPVSPGQLAPLYASTDGLSGKVALVCEGGGQRGIFTAGVLDVFMEEGFDPFDILIGTSAGAQNLSSFMCQARGYAREVITGYTTRAEFFRPLHFARGGDLVDLDWYFDVLANRLPLDTATGLGRLGRRQLLFCSTRAGDYRPHYFDPRHSDWLTGLKASSAIPLFYRAGVEWQGERYLDGGVADAVPVREAYRRGARTLVVVRTVPQHSRFSLHWARRLEGWIGRERLGELMQMVAAHERCFNDTRDFISRPPADARIIEISPHRPLHSRVLGSSRQQLDQDYQLGRHCGLYFLHTLGPAVAALGRQ
ncbi:patatin family protein [Zobellella taiwanensis]|jgi:predicted patatin/cPLA2 family phospholipase|uniref:Patatin family protein n=1 Tax=Zobellella taiwanensis TaxID=347535 RepID=A0A2P7QHX3_9GAMM|nr:patatin-like phospholipase family protein [Zobellella taiwanensis]PSJ37526.1 patatin family protein [Zobellella taiwanensis]